MKLKYQLSPVEAAKKCNMINRSHIAKVAYVYETVNKEHKKELRSSCFGNFIGLPVVIATQFIHNLLMRQVEGEDKETFWFKIGDTKAVRFSLKEFTLVTGLKVGNPEWKGVSVEKAKKCRLVKTYFDGKKKINRTDLLKVFPNVANEKDKYKLGLLIILSYVLLTTEVKVSLQWWFFKLVDNLEAFYNYPWGNLCYEHTVKLFNKDMTETLKKDPVNVTYTLYGFPHALMVWALEAIPGLTTLVDGVDINALPRMRKWTVGKRVSSSKICAILQEPKVEVEPVLVVNNMEKRKPYCVALRKVVGDAIMEEIDVSDEPEPSQEGGATQPSESAKDEILRVVKEENQWLRSQLECIREKVDSLEANAKKAVCINCRAAINNDKVEGEERQDDEVGGDNVGEKSDNELDGGGKVGEQAHGQEKKQSEGDLHVNPLNDMDGGDMVGEEAQSQWQGMEIDDLEGNEDPEAKMEPSYPYFKNLERRLEKVPVFDPYRQLQPKLMEALNSFLQLEDHSGSVMLVDGEVKASEVKALVDGGWVTSPIMNAVFCEISLRQKAYPELFQQDARVLDTYFAIHLRWMFEHRNKATTIGELQFENKLLKYVSGENPKGGQPWSGCRYLYIPVSENNHWFLLKVDLQVRMIYVYDSLKKHLRKKDLEACVTPLQLLIPYLLRKNVDGFEQYGLQKFDMEKVRCPLQKNGSDCGIFTMKFLEFLLGNMDVAGIDNKHMNFWRRKLVAELLAGQFKP